ncbi:hypothetical protein SAMN05421820_108139 [Pedobacter steynii]|uniref:Arylsulfatase n=1 Tax=Pedobacter steynii TaxID=430522 RepID=A0A1H0CJL6_9SPHI|nr:hypothetical protein [Pedobacter steynii]NQX41588.1 hypothetical protein [Pedobacter steynii]SDN58074.1 hypothetical protein SAMN05421820_108139 [Pedobacter steynii]
MKTATCLITFLSIFFVQPLWGQQVSKERPNVIIIYVDDKGYGLPGSYHTESFYS